MKTKRNPFMKMVGGKRGLALIAGTVIGVLAAFGVITPQQAEALGGAAVVLGGAGIVHANIRKQ